MQCIKSITVSTLQELEKASKALLEFAADKKVFAFYGEMGVGKTTFINAICKCLHVAEPTSSPTYAIANEYITTDNIKLYHFDFYRLKTESEAYDMGYEDYFYSGCYCFIEWPENIASLLPPDCVKVNLTIQENKRNLLFEL